MAAVHDVDDLTTWKWLTRAAAKEIAGAVVALAA